MSLIALPAPAQWMLLVLCAGLAGQLLSMMQVPAALFLGPMLVAICFGVNGAGIRIPRALFRFGQGTVGMLVAHAMSLQVLMTAAASWPVMLFATLLTVALSALVGYGAMRWGGMPGSTAAWGTAPGAASAMVALSEDHGADARIVATMQYVRVVCVVMVGAGVARLIGAHGSSPAAVVSGALDLDTTVNVLLTLAAIGAGLLLGSRVPAGALLVPLLLGAGLQLAGLLTIHIPHVLLALAYGAIGCYIGLRFDRATVAYVWRRLPAMIITALVLIALCAVSAWGIARWMGKDFLSVYLATNPGGLDAMAIIAMDTHSDVGFVLALQTLRLFGVVLTGAWIARLIIRLNQRST